MRSTERPSMCPFSPRVSMVDGPFPPRGHRWPTSGCARQPRKSRSESPAGVDLTRLTAQYSRRTPIRERHRFRKVDMVRTIVYSFVAIVVLGTIATPGLGAFALVIAPLLGLWVLWRAALTVSTYGRPIDAVVHTRQSHLLGPGGPDDSFAASPLDAEDYPTKTSTRASASARNSLVPGANVPRPRLSETLTVRARSENSIQGGGE
jgi:hypothetical protein